MAEIGQIASRLGSVVNCHCPEPIGPEMFEICRAIPGLRVAGGAAAAAYMHTTLGTQPGSFGDVDVYALGNLEEKMQTASRLISYLKPHTITRTPFALTMHTNPDMDDRVLKFVEMGDASSWRRFRTCSGKVQLILDPSETMEDVLSSYDLDCCCVYTDGRSYTETERFRAARNSRKNVYRPEFATPSYAYRVAKYFCRGFDIVGAPESFIEAVLKFLTKGIGFSFYCVNPETQSSIYSDSPLFQEISAGTPGRMIVHLVFKTARAMMHQHLGIPQTIVGTDEDATAREMFADTQPQTTLKDWMYRKLGYACEFIESNTYTEEQSQTIRDTIAAAMEMFVAAVEEMRMPPMYSVTMNELRQRCKNNSIQKPQ